MTPEPPFDLAPGEAVVHVALAAKLHGFQATTGRIWVTTQQLVFQPIVPWVTWVVPLVALVFWVMNKRQWLHLPLVEITSHERASFGRNPNVLRLVTPRGEHEILIDTFDDFMTKWKGAA